jgi:hypothetical protein
MSAYNDFNFRAFRSAPQIKRAMMKPKIVLIGTVLLFGNLSFAVEFDRVAFVHVTETVRFDHSVQNVVEALQAKGLEPEVALRKTEKLFSSDRAVSSRRINTLVSAFPELPSGAMTDYLAECALHGKKVDLSSYDALVRLMQSVSEKAMGEKEYERVRRVAEANGRIGAVPAV